MQSLSLKRLQRFPIGFFNRLDWLSWVEGEHIESTVQDEGITSPATRSAICCLSRSIGCLIQPPSAPEAALDQWRSPITVFAVVGREIMQYFVDWCRSQPGRPSKWPCWIVHSFAHREVNIALVAQPMMYGIGSFIDDHRYDPHHH